MNNGQTQDVPMASLQPPQPQINSVAPSAPQGQLDPSVVNLAKSIRDVENPSGDSNAKGASGEWGLYQYKKDTWDADNKKYGTNYQFGSATPQQQNEVAYKKFADLKAQGYNVGQIASIHNSGKPDWTGNVGDNNGVAFNTPDYVDKVSQNYQAYKSGKNTNPSKRSNFSETAENNQPESVGGKAWDVVKGVGNFLFPIVGDVYHDIKGDSNKTFLQQAGDTALSALPFIPGLGEVGEAARGGELAVEGGEALAKGGLSKLASNTVAKGAVTGYGAGVASNLSQGKGLGESFAPDINTIGGAVLGGAAPAVLKGLGSLAEKVSGINPQIKTELERLGSAADSKDAKLYDEYINATKNHATDIRAKAPLTIAADNLDTAASKIQNKVDIAGKAVGDAKTAASNTPLKPLNEVGNSFWKNVQDKYGVNLFTGKNGKIIVKPIEGSLVQTSPSDIARIKNIAQQLSDLHTSGKSTVKQATEIMANLNNLVDHSRSDIYGHTNDPLEGLIKHTAGNLNEVIRSSSPKLAKANDAFSGLKDLQGEISGMAGKNLNKGELLMRRVFSGDKSGDVQDLFGKIKGETGIDLIKHAVLAKHAIETVGSKADKTLLEQAIQAGAGGDKMGFIKSVLQTTAKKLGANPEKIGRRLISGKTPELRNSLLTKGAIESSRFLHSALEK